MIKETSISRCKKSDFKAFEKLDNKSFKLSWGKMDEVERVSVFNEETGEPEFTGEVRDTDWCTYESGVYEGVLNPYFLDEALSNVKRHASVDEYREFYNGMGLDDERQLPLLKEKLGNDIDRYDSSDAVNVFTIKGVNVWLDKATRSGLLLRFQSELATGKSETALWYDGMKFDLLIENAIQMLYALEVYASACYDNTQMKKADKERLADIGSVLSFDLKGGYPPVLNF